MTTTNASITLDQLAGETIWLRRLASSLVADHAEDVVYASARPDEIVDRIKLHRLLAGYVLELAPTQRDAVLLHYFDGLTSIEIGNRLGIAAGTVRWRFRRAVDELRARLDAESPNRAWLVPMLGLAKGYGAATTTVSTFALAALATVAVIVGLIALPRVGQPAAASTPVAHELAGGARDVRLVLP